MSDLEPNTRAENFWVNEGDLEPITRKEQYIKHLYDETQVVPEYPKTREEYFINKAGEELHDVTIEQLTVTENGTYSEAGKAFSPVFVNVPEPTLKTKSITANGTYQASSDNADGYSSVTVNVEGYKITDVENLPSPIATFSDGANLPMPKLEVAIEPVQSGSGDPSPENIRPISGWSAVNVTDCGKNIATTEIYKNNYVLADDGAENYAGGFIITKEIKINSSNNYYVRMVGGQTSSSDAIRIGYFDGNFNFIRRENQSSPILLSVSDNAEYIRLSYRYIDPYFKDIQIEVGNTATTYEPYAGTTYTIPFTDSQGNPIEVFGGSVDVVNGGGDDDREKLMLADDVSWIKYGSYEYGIRLITTKFDSISNDLLMEKSMSNMLTFSTTWGEGDDRIVFGQGNSKTSLLLSTASTGLDANSSVDDVKAWLRTAGAYMIAPLATPTTFYTQPTAIKSLQGINNVFADTGDVLEASYWESL